MVRSRPMSPHLVPPASCHCLSDLGCSLQRYVCGGQVCVRPRRRHRRCRWTTPPSPIDDTVTSLQRRRRHRHRCRWTAPPSPIDNTVASPQRRRSDAEVLVPAPATVWQPCPRRRHRRADEGCPARTAGRRHCAGAAATATGGRGPPPGARAGRAPSHSIGKCRAPASDVHHGCIGCKRRGKEPALLTSF